MESTRKQRPQTARRRLVLRTAFLLLGAAIFVAFLLLQISVGTILSTILPLPVAVAIVALPPLFVGFLPGLRDVEVAAARTLLGVNGDLISPPEPGWDHRWRSALWVLLHLILGGLLGLALVAGVPILISFAVSAIADPAPLGTMRFMPVPEGAAEVALFVLAVLIICGIIVVLVVMAGLWLAALAPTLLGPTWRDRLEVAHQRLLSETEHRRLARDLHDGVGHALSIISLQAVAGRRVLETKPDKSAASLQTIETVARQALDDLDHMLGVLRDDPAPRAPERGLADLPTIFEAHRQIGMNLEATVDEGLELPALLSTTTYRIVSEALTNAQRYAGTGPVRAEVGRIQDRLVIDVCSPLRPGRRSRARGGRGLAGIGERAALFGGEVRSGPDGDTWVLHAELPLAESTHSPTTSPRIPSPNQKEPTDG